MLRSRAASKADGVDQVLQAYRRHAAAVTDQAVNPPKTGRGWRGSRKGEAEGRAREEAEAVLAAYDRCLRALEAALPGLAGLRRPRLLGKVEEAQAGVRKATAKVAEARLALERADLAACGKAVSELHRHLSLSIEPLTVAVTAELGQAVVPREKSAALQANVEALKQAQRQAAQARQQSPRAGLLAWARVYELTADGVALAAEVLGRQPAPAAPRRRSAAKDDALAVVAPQELETLDQVGGLEEAKDHLQRTVGALVGAAAGGPGLVHNGILLHGPPGTGKTLLARAVAGEYGLRFLRFSPAAIASAYQHEPAKKLRQVFALAAESAPCVLFLDEVEAIGARRETLASADQREIVTQLLNSLEDYRGIPGLLIMAATNALDQLDPALREGRFDVRIAVPLPDATARVDILEVCLNQQGVEVDWSSFDLGEVAERTAGRSGAALASIVSGAAQRAVSRGAALGQADLLAEIEGRSGQDRAQTLEEQVAWEDVVLPEAIRGRLVEILSVFERPELARQLGVRAPAGILLHGPPGTGKTTVAKALATEVRASFYEMSAADLLSKYVGESEQKVAQLFARARQNRPSIVFLDEIDALLKRRATDSATPWEERVVSQFLRELDGLHSGEGVLLVGATNRLDIIDEAVRDRRLVPIEVPLPDAEGRLRLLEVLCRGVRLGPDVDLGFIAEVSEGLSGADLKAVRNSAGMKALARSARAGDPGGAAVSDDDFVAALAERRPLWPSQPRAH